MNDKLNQTMKILRSRKITTDNHGRTVWVDPVESANLELVSTQMLKKIIATDDGDTTDKLRKIADGADGLLARDIDKGRFEIIRDEELQRILDGTDTEPEAEAGSMAGLDEEPVAEIFENQEELELVSTQMLRRILDPDDEEQIIDTEPDDSGFNPYDHG